MLYDEIRVLDLYGDIGDHQCSVDLGEGLHGEGRLLTQDPNAWGFGGPAASGAGLLLTMPGRQKPLG